MKHNKFTIVLLYALTFLTFFSGIIRHDVKEEEYLKLANQKQFDCVGRVYNDSTAIGSCVLIADRYVLSAAHVFIERVGTSYDTTKVDGQVIISPVLYSKRELDITKMYFVFNGLRIKGKRLLIHPKYLDSLAQGTCDIAIIELENTISSITPAKINSSFDELNSNVIGVGYGASGPADQTKLVGDHNKKIAGENTVDTLTGQKYLGFETLLMCDFDHPTRKDCNKIGSHIPKPLEYIGSGGDSGGGLFRKNGGWELIGIFSSTRIDVNQFIKTQYYGQTMQWTRVSIFKDWVNGHTK